MARSSTVQPITHRRAEMALSDQNQTEPVKVWAAINARQESIQML